MARISINVILLIEFHFFYIPSDSILVPVINCLTSLYAGFVIFSVLGFMATQKGVTIDEVADSGMLGYKDIVICDSFRSYRPNSFCF